jgi:hypothetical protein
MMSFPRGAINVQSERLSGTKQRHGNIYRVFHPDMSISISAE